MSSSSSQKAPAFLRFIGALSGIAFAFPAAYLVIRNFTLGSNPFELIVSPRILSPLWRTVRLAVGVSLASVALGTSMAWLLTRTNVYGRKIWQVMVPIPLVFPSFIGAAAFIRTLNPGGLANRALKDIGITAQFELRGYFGAWLVLTLFTFPYVFLPVAARLRRLPGSIEESARVLGDSPLQAFRKVVIPQITAQILAGGLLVFLYVISDFGAVQLMRYDTLTRAIQTSYLGNAAVAFALSLILLALALVTVLGERLVSRSSRSVGSARASRTAQYDLGSGVFSARSFSALFCAFVIAMAVFAPLSALLDWSISGLRRAFGGGRRLTIGLDQVIESTVSTVWVSLLAAVITVLAVLPVAYLYSRHKDPIGRISNAVVINSFAIPGILVALALRYFTLRSGAVGDLFFDTTALLVFAYVVRFGSLAMGTVQAAIDTVPQRFIDAASTLGAGRMKTIRTIELPLIAPGLAAAGGLVLLSTMKELPISLILSPLGFSTLTTRTFQAFEDAFVAEAGVLATVLVVISAALTWLLVLRRIERTA